MSPARLAPEDIDAIAERVVELLRDDPTPVSGGMVDAATLAKALGVKRDYVYSHSDALGGIRIGDGDKPRLRFDLEAATAAHRDRPNTLPAVPSARPRRRRRHAATTGVLTSRPRPVPGNVKGGA